MKASDVKKAMRIIEERSRDEALLNTLASGEALSLSVGKVDIQLTPAVQQELRNRIHQDMTQRIAEATKQLEDLGVET